MNPTEIIGNCHLYLGDCREILPSLPKVDLVLTDPPYDKKTHENHMSEVSDRQALGFEQLDDSGFLSLCRTLIDKTNRWVLMTCATSHALLAMNLEEFIRMGIWVKPNGAPQFTGDRPGTGWEAVAILHRKGNKKWNGGGHHAVWTHNIASGEHPTQKPVGLIEKWIDQFSIGDESILDPFMGSGTTGVACANMGKTFYGIERERKYFDIACKRIEDAYRQERLFA